MNKACLHRRLAFSSAVPNSKGYLSSLVFSLFLPWQSVKKFKVLGLNEEKSSGESRQLIGASDSDRQNRSHRVVAERYREHKVFRYIFTWTTLTKSMPFLFPAVSAASCDAAIIFLSTHLHVSLKDGAVDDDIRNVYKHRYILPLALVRLFLLFVPFPYHSYTGTAVKCPILYQLLYGLTLVALSVHMLSLIMIDPASLGSLLPFEGTTPTVHDHATRHLWSILILSLVSDLCHYILFLHVRSTAPSNAEIQQGRPKVLFYYMKDQSQNNDSITERDSLLGGSSPTPSQESFTRVQRIKNELFQDLRGRLKKTKSEWTKKLDEYLGASGAGGGGAGQDLLQRHHRGNLTPFRVLLQLFAYEEVLTNGRLDAIYDADHGEALIFFVPQLLSFLLHGAYESSSRLEEWVLETCRKNVYFSHRCYWFLRAWCLESHHRDQDDEYPTRLSRPNSFSSLDGFISTDSDVAGGAGSKSVNTLKRNKNEKFLPEERAVLEQLLVRIMECGEDEARALEFGSGLESSDSYYSQSSFGQQEDESSSPSSLMAAAETGILPIDPQTGMPSAKHWDCLAAPRKFGFLPLDRALTNPQSRNSSLQQTFFDATPLFFDALLNMADNLFQFNKEQRTDELKRQLKKLEVEMLPSNSLYVPLQDFKHRVWRIVAEESIAISTKERVPMIVCLEVIDYDLQALSTSPLKRERSSSVELPQLNTDTKSPKHEKEILNKWRYGPRPPHRRDTPFEKFAYQMRHGIKNIPIDQMKTSVKAQMKKLKDTKTNVADFFALNNVPDTFSDDEETLSNVLTGPQERRTSQSLISEDIERGDSLDGDDFPVPPTPAPSERNVKLQTPLSGDAQASPIANTRMGQWSSPHHTADHGMRQAADDDHPVNLKLGEQQGSSYLRGKYNASTGDYGSNFPTTNGSSTSPPKARRGKRNRDKARRPPSSSKPPPVVFKEDWHQKEERLRPLSAFGSHPGWRLLPVLIKSNDDLRQEQLASQLIYQISIILARERVNVWLCPYEILALTETGGIIEAIPDTISIASLKKNDPDYVGLKNFFDRHFDGDALADAKANFVESLAAYSIVCFLLQIKDRHNGNILLDNRGHLIHIDFGFFFLSSPGKNTGFESAPFKLTRDFVDVLGGPDSHMFRTFRALCYKTFIALRRHCMEIILLVEMLKKGNEDLACFRGRPDDAIRELRERFRLDLNDRACLEYVNALIDDSLENWRTNWYDRYQRYCVGVL